MIASWMLYCALCACGLSLAAVLAERVLLAGRGPVRQVWFGAIVLSVILPALALHSAPRASVASGPAPIGVGQTSAPVAPIASPPASSLPRARQQVVESTSRTTRTVTSTLARADQPLGVAWLMLSLGLLLYFFGSVAALAVMRRRWRRRIVLGVPVLISEHTGPALVGALSPAIVVPEWALEMEPRQLALMLQHEQEHRRARDGQLLTLAHFAVIVMPWNVALWWQLARLRTAVEMDCDARVLRDADARSYGNLLLDVVRPRRGLRIMGATAFAERATQLERRIRVLARRRDRASHGARALAGSLALSAVAVAWAAPRPLAPALDVRPAGQSHRGTTSALTANAPLPAVKASTVHAPAANSPTAAERSRPTALSDATIAALQRYGTSGIINPMLMLLRNTDSLGLSARQADSIATLNRWYMVRLNGIWSPVGRHHAGGAVATDQSSLNATDAQAPAASMNLLIQIAPYISSLLTADQRSKLPPSIAEYLDSQRLAAIGAGVAGAPDGVFAPNGGLGNGRGSRGRVGGPGTR